MKTLSCFLQVISKLSCSICCRHEEVINWLTKAPHARKAHPSPDHFMPLLVALGAAGEKPATERIHSSFQMGTFSMASFAFHGTGPK